MADAIFDKVERGVQLASAMVTNYSLTSQRDAVQNVFGSVVHTVCLSFTLGFIAAFLRR
jgi:hypothetical protein